MCLLNIYNYSVAYSIIPISWCWKSKDKSHVYEFPGLDKYKTTTRGIEITDRFLKSVTNVKIHQGILFTYCS
jgi:hypothetical protein